MTVAMFGMVQVVPRIAPRVGNTRLMIAGLIVALIGMAWLSRISIDTQYFPQIALPMLLLGVGAGVAMIPLTGAGIAGVAPRDAGAASGLVNVASQIGGSLGLAILITVFAAASQRTTDHPAPAAVQAQAVRGLAEGVASALSVSAVFLALALAVVVFVIRRPPAATVVAHIETATAPAPELVPDLDG